MKKVHGRIDVSAWYKRAAPALLEDLMAQTVNDLLRLIVEGPFEDGNWGGPFLYFPAIFGDDDGDGGPPPDDPLALSIKLDLGGDEDDDPVYRTSLGEILDMEIDGCERGYDEYNPGLARIRDGLRQLADRIDRALTSHGQTAEPPPQT